VFCRGPCILDVGHVGFLGEARKGYVGMTTRGGYEQLQDFSYVGPGGGSFERTTSTTVTGWRLKSGPALLLMLVVGAAAVATCNTGATGAKARGPEHSQAGVSGGLGESTADIRVAFAAHPLRYNCLDGLQDSLEGWLEDKQAWCCVHERRGCPPPLFNCSSDDAGMRSWPLAQQEWCCKFERLACPTTTMVFEPALPPEEEEPQRLRGPSGSVVSSVGDADEDRGVVSLGCESLCAFDGRSASCRERIQAVANYAYPGRKGGCELAFADVRQVCAPCRSGCVFRESGCVETNLRPAHNCTGFFEAWTEEERNWCCAERGQACGTV